MLKPRRKGRFDLPSHAGQVSLFLGQWAPTLLLLGVYNKIVKVAGSDRFDGPGELGGNFDHASFEKE